MIETSNGFIPTPDMGEQWLIPEEFSRLLSCTPQHVHHLCRTGGLAAFGIHVYCIEQNRLRRRYFIRTPLSML